MKLASVLDMAIGAIVYHEGYVDDARIMAVAAAIDPDSTTDIAFRATEVTFSDGSVARFPKD